MTVRPFTIKDTKEVIKFSIENSNEIKIPIILWGYHGIGKTQLVTQIADELGYHLEVLHLSTQDIIDLIGRPITKEVILKGETYQVQDWCIPNWLQRSRTVYENEGKNTIFFLDEMNRGPRIVQSAMLPFLIEGKMHSHQINTNDAIIAACNPADDNYDVNDLTDKAHLDRLGHLVLKPTSKEYIKYLRSKNIDEATIQTISKDKSLIKIPDIDIGFEVEPSHRKIENIMSIVGKKDLDWINKTGVPVIKAYLGDKFLDLYLAEKNKINETITMDMLYDYKNNEEIITKLLTLKIDGYEEINMGVLENTKEMIISEIEEQGGLNLENIDMFVNFFSNKMIPDDEIASIFSNQIISISILDIEVNKKIRNFIENSNVFNPTGAEIW